MKPLLAALLSAPLFYALGLFACLWLLPMVSSNTHDSGVEAAMAGAFLAGPLTGLIGFGLVLAFWPRRK